MLAVFAVLLTIYGTIGCSKEEPGKPAGAGLTNQPQAIDEISAAKRYDPTSMIEVNAFSDLPTGVKAHANANYMSVITDGSAPKFLVGGASKTSAIIAFEQFGYVPFFYAQSYAYIESQWVPAKRWRLDSGITSLHDLVAATTALNGMQTRPDKAR